MFEGSDVTASRPFNHQQGPRRRVCVGNLSDWCTEGWRSPAEGWRAVGDFGVAIRPARLGVMGLLDQLTLFSQVLQEEELSNAMCSLMKFAFF